MRFRLLVADLDGTLVGSEGVSPANRKAVAQLREAGLVFSVCTGRMPIACFDILRDLNIRNLSIFANGALVASPLTSETVLCLSLDNAVAREAAAFAREYGMSLEMYTRDGAYVDSWTPNIELHAEVQGVIPVVTDLLELTRREVVVKASVVATTPEEKETVQRFARAFAGKLALGLAKTPLYPEADLINVTRAEVSKGPALRVLVGHMGLSTGEVVAIGDGSNDQPLLQESGYPIAMGNAPDELKSIARYVTESVDEDGFAGAVDRLLSGELP